MSNLCTNIVKSSYSPLTCSNLYTTQQHITSTLHLPTSKLHHTTTPQHYTTPALHYITPHQFYITAHNYTYLSSISRHMTSVGRIPDSIRSSIGGFLSEESSFLTAWTAANRTSGSSLRVSDTKDINFSAVSCCFSIPDSSFYSREDDEINEKNILVYKGNS